MHTGGAQHPTNFITGSEVSKLVVVIIAFVVVIIVDMTYGCVFKLCIVWWVGRRVIYRLKLHIYMILIYANMIANN